MTVAPPPGRLLILHQPPADSARSRMVLIPRWPGALTSPALGSNPTPLSCTLTR